MLVHELLRRLLQHEVGETIPAGLVQFLRISLRPDLIGLLRPEYFMRPIEHTEARGLVIEFIMLWDPSDAEVEILAEKMAPHAAEFKVDIHAALERTRLDKFLLPDTGMSPVDVRKRLLALLSLLTKKAIQLRSTKPGPESAVPMENARVGRSNLAVPSAPLNRTFSRICYIQFRRR